MQSRTRIWIVWLSIGALIALIAVPLARPMAVAWRCLWLHQNAPRERAVVLHRFERNASFALRIEAGPNAGETCTADTSRERFDATQVGDTLDVVRVDWEPGTCELVSTLEASAQILAGMSAVIAVLLMGLIALGVFLTRSFCRPQFPKRRLAVPPDGVRCPACGERMEEGYVPAIGAISWRRLGEPIGLPHALRGLPGTVDFRGRPRLHAFRCTPCEVLTLQYGRPDRR